jgi:hypothetical protein
MFFSLPGTYAQHTYFYVLLFKPERKTTPQGSNTFADTIN